MSKETLYLLPGLLCDAYTYEKQIAALKNDYDVRVLDFFGCDSMTMMAERVFKDAPQRFSVCGFSMGGRVALQMYHMQPERIARLCLLDTGVTPVAEGEAEKRQALIDLANKRGMNALCSVWLPPMLHPDRRNDASIVEPLTAMVCRATPAIFEGQIRALLTREDARPLLPTMKMPVTVAVGRQDEWSTVAQHEGFAKQIPGAKLTVIEESGHFVPVEQPEALNAVLRDLMAQPI